MSKKAKYIIVILAALFLIGIIAVNVRKAPQGQPEQQSQSTDAAAAQSESEPAAPNETEPAADSAAYSEKDVPIFKDAATGETVELRFYEDMPNVAYIDIADYYHLYLPDKEMSVEESGTDTGVYTVVNATGSATVDTEAETISSDDMAGFTNVMILTQEDMDNTYLDGAPYVRVADTQYTPEKSTVTYNLADYGIDVRADEEGLYLPVATLCDMYSDLVYHSAFYDGAKVYVEDTNLDRTPSSVDPEYEKNHYTAMQRPEDLADFTYRELCFAIDHFYGLPGTTQWRRRGWTGRSRNTGRPAKRRSGCFGPPIWVNIWRAWIILTISFMTAGIHSSFPEYWERRKCPKR